MENELKKVKFVQLRSEGQTYQDISNELDISKPTLIKWSRELQCELSNEIELKKDEAKKTFGLSYSRSLELKSIILEKIMEEVKFSNFSSLPKYKLIELALRILEDTESRSLTLSYDDFNIGQMANEIKFS